MEKAQRLILEARKRTAECKYGAEHENPWNQSVGAWSELSRGYLNAPELVTMSALLHVLKWLYRPEVLSVIH